MILTEYLIEQSMKHKQASSDRRSIK